MGGTAIVVDGLAIVGIGTEEFYFGAQGSEELVSDGTSGTVGAVNGDMKAFKVGSAEII